jgi:K+-transporting ATPase ATPase C chain
MASATWLNSFPRQLAAAARMLLVMTVVLGIAYPLVILGVGQVVAHGAANGSLVQRSGAGGGAGSTAVGSTLIGQAFTGPQWFQSRPSASDYTGDVSGGSNLAPSDKRQLDAVAKRRSALTAAAAKAGATTQGPLPADALTASASGLDPHISPAYALWQVPVVAAARKLSPAAVSALVTAHTQGRVAGFLGEPRVNVLELNLALAQLH